MSLGGVAVEPHHVDGALGPERPAAFRLGPSTPSMLAAGAAVVVAGVAGTLLPYFRLSLVLAVLGAAVIASAIALHPPLAAYTVIGLTPLIAGMDRGSVIPVLRPSEALAVVASAGLASRGLARSRTRGFPKLALGRTDISILLLASASSIVPILWMLLRRANVEQDDVLYALLIWKFYGTYLIVRCSVRSGAQTKVCLYVAIVAGVAVAIIGVLQVLQLFGVVPFLQHYYTSFGNESAVGNSRGGATLSLPIAAADLFVFDIAVAFALLVRGPTRGQRALLAGSIIVLIAGVLAAGQFTGVIALVVAGAALARLTGRGRYVVRMIPVILVLAWPLQTVLESRLANVNEETGLPVSWVGRLDNLRTYFWPRLFSDWQFVLGVRPSSRVATPKFASGWVWIESGYTWLLWAGGIPLLLAFVYFVRVNLRHKLPAARHRADAIGAASLAVVVGLVVVAVCMVLDPHLTYRGSADLLFGLLAMASVAVDSKRVHRFEVP